MGALGRILARWAREQYESLLRCPMCGRTGLADMSDDKSHKTGDYDTDHVLTLDLKSLGDGLDPRIVIASLMRFVVRHIGKTGSAAHGASQQGFVLLSRHLANMRPRASIFQCGTLPQSN